jgi:DNA polymerase mu
MPSELIPNNALISPRHRRAIPGFLADWSRIPRQEVEEIADCVMEHLDALVDGCEYTICGGYVGSMLSQNSFRSDGRISYRRGKTESGDMDIVFCPPNEGQDIGLLKDLYLRLSALGIVTHVLRTPQPSPEFPNNLIRPFNNTLQMV